MKIKIEKRFLTVPINTFALPKKLCFYKGDGDLRTLVREYDCKIDLLQPNFTAYLDVQDYIGQELDYECEPELALVFGQADTNDPDGVYEEPYRPTVHFSVKNGWNNDPNGMIYYHGVYHMFYQYNPCDTAWGNMHWGHATSKDMIRWEEQAVALFPDQNGVVFSGSAIEDTRNASGLQNGELPLMLLYYTAAGGRRLSRGKGMTQCLAISKDGGKSFEKYEKNPLIGTVTAANRDPKVVWVEELSRYVMVLYLCENNYGLFVSDDLINWSLLQELTIDGETECPDLQPFVIDGHRYWVLIGASDRYIVGHFANGKYIPLSKVKQLNYSTCSYAAQSFSGLTDGRVCRVAWNRLNMPCSRATQQMGISMEMGLKKEKNDFFLTAKPVRELETLYADEQVIREYSLERVLELSLQPSAYDLHLSVDLKDDVRITVFGHTFEIDAKSRCMKYGKHILPIGEHEADIRMVVDRCSFEVFADEGRVYAVFPLICDYNLPMLRIASKENAGGLLSLTSHRLVSIYPK